MLRAAAALYACAYAESWNRTKIGAALLPRRRPAGLRPGGGVHRRRGSTCSCSAIRAQWLSPRAPQYCPPVGWIVPCCVRAGRVRLRRLAVVEGASGWVRRAGVSGSAAGTETGSGPRLPRRGWHTVCGIRLSGVWLVTRGVSSSAAATSTTASPGLATCRSLIGFIPGTTHPCLPRVRASGQRHPTGYGNTRVLAIRRELHVRRAAAAFGTTTAPTRAALSRRMPPRAEACYPLSGDA